MSKTNLNPTLTRLTDFASCGGCAAKMSPGHLAEVLGDRQRTPHPDLLVGFEGSEDAGVFRIAPDRALVMTTDFFPPMVDDPYTFGRVAAANALSDVYAMGGRPLAALNLLGAPKDMDRAMVAEVLAGGASMVREAGAVIVGGHTLQDKELKYGLAVTGEVHPDRFIRNHGIQPNDMLILTKPLGCGLATSSIKAYANRGPVVAEAIRWMTTLNKLGIERIIEAAPHALTDVTGFGLAGHLMEMLAEDALVAQIDFSRVPRLLGIETCFDPKLKTRGARTTREFLAGKVSFHSSLSEWDQELIFDPQTSGGLLIAVPPSRADMLARDLRSLGLEYATIIGSVVSGAGPAIRVQAEPAPKSFSR
jgi:selenide,water dikinase